MKSATWLEAHRVASSVLFISFSVLVAVDL